VFGLCGSVPLELPDNPARDFLGDSSASSSRQEAGQHNSNQSGGKQGRWSAESLAVQAVFAPPPAPAARPPRGGGGGAPGNFFFFFFCFPGKKGKISPRGRLAKITILRRFQSKHPTTSEHARRHDHAEHFTHDPAAKQPSDRGIGTDQRCPPLRTSPQTDQNQTGADLGDDMRLMTAGIGGFRPTFWLNDVLGRHQKMPAPTADPIRRQGSRPEFRYPSLSRPAPPFLVDPCDVATGFQTPK